MEFTTEFTLEMAELWWSFANHQLTGCYEPEYMKGAPDYAEALADREQHIARMNIVAQWITANTPIEAQSIPVQGELL
jgi:hypothetical protein